MSLPRTTPRAALIAVAAAALVSCSDTGKDAAAGGDAVMRQTFSFASPGGQMVITYPAAERAPVMNFSGPSLMDPDTTISLSDFDDEVVVLSAWGQWCGPCRTEVDDLQRIQDSIAGRGGTVLGVNVRDYSEQIARDFVVDNGVTYPSIWDPPFKTAGALGGIPASVVPTTVVLDRQHRPAAVFLREITADEVMDVVNPLLAEDPKASG